MKVSPFVILLSEFLLLQVVNSASYEKCPKGDPDKLNVHIVSHTHNDVGWLKTPTQYYYGAKSDIQNAGVQYILDSVINFLQNDPNKKFIYVETAFFYMWWNDQHDMIRHPVKKLVCDGQLEFISGGWSMNDEAASHYNSIIDQMTWGHRILKDIFGDCAIPKVAWQIDPFGHSREQASLFAQMYFDGLFLGRLDYQDKDTRGNTKTMEHIWKGSPNLGPVADLFTGVLPNGYSPPNGFCFDIGCDDPPIMDKYEDNNVEQRVSEFMKVAQDEAQYYATNHIIMTMGNDFNYQSAGTWFNNLDKLIYYVNQKQNNGSKINVFYSTPSCYLYALNQAGQTWPIKSDDFFPYANDPHAYWTGYFTSRPSLKRYERIGNNNLQMCKQLSALADIDDYDLKVFREAMGIMQHHDAITGTAKQAVTNNYYKTLASAIDICQKYIVNDTLNSFMMTNTSVVSDQLFCNYLNISECPVMEKQIPVAVTIYNPLGWNISTYIRLPVSGNAYKVYSPKGSAVEAQILNIADPVLKVPGRNSSSKKELVFKVDLPPLGFSTYLVRATTNLSVAKEQTSVILTNTKSDWTIGNEFFKLIINNKTGLLSGARLADGTNISLSQNFYWYRGMNGNNSKFEFRASGAYIFRPNGTEPIPLGKNVAVTYINGSFVQEIRQVFNPWLSQSIRVYKGVNHIEFNWIVGPIPFEDHVGKEIITRFDSDLKTDFFKTDSNGREMLKRILNYRPSWKLNISEPISGNYYPVTSRIYIRDKKRNLQLTLLNDRSQGGTSLKNGSLELMVHRRLLHDDAFGVGEALNETGVDGRGLVVQGSHYLIISNISSSASKHRPLAQKLYLQPTLSFSPYNMSESDYIKSYRTEYSGLSNSLPPNVHLLTLEPWKKATKLIRLEHFYEFDEDPDTLSKPVKLNLQNLFSAFEITAINETTLSANQFLNQATRLHWNSDYNKIGDFNSKYKSGKFQKFQGSVADKLEISLKPMQIRTFIATVKIKK